MQVSAIKRIISTADDADDADDLFPTFSKGDFPTSKAKMMKPLLNPVNRKITHEDT
jgi:hypothetical protein